MAGDSLFGWASSRRLVFCILQPNIPVDQDTLVIVQFLSIYSFGCSRAGNPHVTTNFPGNSKAVVSSCGASEALRQASFRSWSNAYFQLAIISSCSVSWITVDSPAEPVASIENYCRSVSRNQNSISLLTQRLYDWRIIRFLFYDGYTKKAQIIRRVFSTQRSNTEEWDGAPCIEHVKPAEALHQYSRRDQQNKWVFYDY